MIEELFRIGSFSISPFGVMLVAALMTAYWQLARGMRFYGFGSDDDASSLVFAAGFFGILGGKIYYAMLVGDWRMIYDRAGIVWYGCFVGGILALMWVVRRRKLPVARTFDACAPGLALGYSVGRVGCFLVGDDYGTPTDLPWGVVFKVGLPPTTAGILRDQFGVAIPAEIADSEWVHVHPTQIYETIASFAIWILVLKLRNKSLPAGMMFPFVCSLMAVERFLVEFVRAKDDRFFGSFTLAQLISVVVFIGATALCYRLWRRNTA